MTVLPMQNVSVLRQQAAERELALRRTTLLVGRERTRRSVRRWVGYRLVRLGTRLAGDPTMRPVRAR